MTLAFQIDKNDKHLLKYRWALKNGYLFRSLRIGKISKSVYLHHCIIGYPLNGNVVDHVNGNSLDNRRSNLRVVSQRENVRNNPVYRKRGLTGYTKKGSRYQAQVKLKGKVVYLGTFDTPLEASKAYWEALI